MRKEGSITIFVCLIFVCVSALICGLLESARTSGAQLYLQNAGDSAIDSLFSRYHRQLWERYRILLLECEGDEKAQRLLQEYLKPYVENSDVYPISNPQITIPKRIQITEEGGKWLEKEIVDYMSLGILETAFEEDPDTLWKEIEEAKSMKTITQDYGSSSQEVVGVEEALMQLDKNFKKQKDSWEAAREAAGRHDTWTVRRKLGEFRTALRSVEGLVKKYEAQADQMEQNLLEKASRHSENMEKLSDTNRSIMEGEIEQFQEYSKKDGERRVQIRSYISQAQEKIEALSDLEAQLDAIEEAIQAAEEEEEEEDVEALWDSFYGSLEEIPAMTMDVSFGIADEAKEQELIRLAQILQTPVLGLVLPKDRLLSQKWVDTARLPSRASTQGSTDSNLLNRVLVGEYMGNYFADFTDEIDSMPLSYELEYLFAGNASDISNLSTTVLSILAIREGMNFIHILTDQEKMDQAEALALAIAGVTGYPEAAKVVKFLVITVWAGIEAVMDVRALLNREKVPLLKTKEDWKTGLNGMGEKLDLKKGGKEEEEIPGEKGFDYETYVKLLLFLLDSRTRNFRMMDIMQLDIGVEQPDFLMGDMTYGIEAGIQCDARRIFSDLPFISREMSGLSSRYNMQIHVEKQY